MSRWFRRLVLLVLVIKIDHPIAVRAVRRQNGQDDEIRNQQSQIKGVDLVKALKSLVQKMLAKVGHQPRGGEAQDPRQRGKRGRKINKLRGTINKKNGKHSRHCTCSILKI